MFYVRSRSPAFIPGHYIRWFQLASLAAVPKALRGAFYCLEGDKTALRTARSIVKDLEGKAFYPVGKQDPLPCRSGDGLPASGCLFDLAAEMLSACGISKKSARQVLLPLVEVRSTI